MLRLERAEHAPRTLDSERREEMMECTSNEFVAFAFHDVPAAEGALRRAAEQIEQHTTYRVCDLWLSPRRKLGVLNLCAAPAGALAEPLLARLSREWLANRPQTNRLRVRAELALLQTGYTTSAERRFERSLREDGQRLSCTDAGGIAAFCLVRFGGSEEERLFLWSTRPGLRAIASAEAPEGWVFGTRPRLVHALTRQFRAPSLDHGYVRAGICGWSLGDLTPYEGTTLLPVDMLWRVQGGVRTLHPHPTQPFQRQERSLRRQRALYRDALRTAVEPLRSLRGFELRLSGGKDSRLVAAAIAERRIVPSTVVSHGPEGSREVSVAAAVAARLGWTLHRRRPTFGYRGGLNATARYNLALADGFFATEPRHIAFPVHSLADDVGPGIVIGHIELQKGGWAVTAREQRERVLKMCRIKVVRQREALVPELCEAARRVLDDYAATLQPASDAEYAYLLNYRFRVGRWLTSHTLAHARQLLPVYPLVDEKVTRVVSCAPFWHLTSERLLAETTWDLAPTLRDTPLSGDPYRFIVHRQQAALAREQKRRELDGAGSSAAAASALTQREGEAGGHVQRQAAPAPRAPGPEQAASAQQQETVDSTPPSGGNATRRANLDARGDLFMSEDIANEICAHIRAGKLRDELRAYTAPHAWAIIEDPTHSNMQASGLSAVRLDELLLTFYQASVMHTDGLADW